MTPFKRLLPVLTLLAASAAASAQPSPPDTASPPVRPSVLAIEDPRTPPRPPPTLALRVQERSDVAAVRREIIALRLACAAMPAHIYSTIAVPMPLGSRPALEPIMSRPYAPEEDTCAAILNPDRVGAESALQMGVIGAGFTLLALMFFTLIGGVLRVLWHGPMARTFPMILANRFHD